MKRILIIAVSILMTVGCRQTTSSSPSQTGANSATTSQTTQSLADGTVDGGGGNTVQDLKTGDRKLLDLAENSDNEPFDFDPEVLAKQDGDEAKGWAFLNILYTPLLKSWAGEDGDFFSWALEVAMRTNAVTSDPKFDKSYDIIHSEAFAIPEAKNLHNLQFAFTDKELDAVGDQGLMRVANPQTKRQVAVQDNKGFVLINRREFNSLDIDSKLALKLHESILYLLIKFNPGLIKKEGTAPMREFVKNLFNYAYRATLTGQHLVSPRDVKKSFLALGLPMKQVDYSSIAKAADQNADPAKFCSLRTTYEADPSLMNRAFFREGKQISGAYAMDVDFYMKLALYLTKTGQCVIQPRPCELAGSDKDIYKNKGQYSIKIDNVLLDDSDDAQYLQNVVLKKYQLARICK